MNTKRRIIAASISLFGSQGCQNTTVGQIAEIAGISKADVHHHFGSKDNLILCALEHTITLLEVEIENAMAVALISICKAPGNELLNYVKLILKIDRQDSIDAFRLIVSQAFFVGFFQEYLVTTAYARHQRFIKGCLTRATEYDKSFKERSLDKISRVMAYYLVASAIKFISADGQSCTKIYVDLFRDFKFLLKYISGGDPSTKKSLFP